MPAILKCCKCEVVGYPVDEGPQNSPKIINGLCRKHRRMLKKWNSDRRLDTPAKIAKRLRANQRKAEKRAAERAAAPPKPSKPKIIKIVYRGRVRRVKVIKPPKKKGAKKRNHHVCPCCSMPSNMPVKVGCRRCLDYFSPTDEYRRSEIARKAREYRAKSDIWRNSHRQYSARRRSSDPMLRISNSMGGSMRMALAARRRNKQGRHWEVLVGYTTEDLKARLERRFLPGMSWSNYGDWHIDHIIPVSAFNFSTPDDIDFKRCWALSNLQPMWAADNVRKSNKLAKPFQPALKLCA